MVTQMTDDRRQMTDDGLPAGALAKGGTTERQKAHSKPEGPNHGDN